MNEVINSMSTTIDTSKLIPGRGYIFNFLGKGAFDPNGKLKGEMTQAQIDEHNQTLSAIELETAKTKGRAMLYLFREAQATSKCLCVGTWAATPGQRFVVTRSRNSLNNFGARRIDVWFTLGGSKWHGINIGDNDIVRAKKLKRQ